MTSKSKKEKLYARIGEAHTLSMIETQKKLRKLYPYEMIKGEGWGFFVNIETKQLVKINLGRQLIRVSEEVDNKGRHLVYIENQYVLVPQELIENIGYN